MVKVITASNPYDFQSGCQPLNWLTQLCLQTGHITSKLYIYKNYQSFLSPLKLHPVLSVLCPQTRHTDTPSPDCLYELSPQQLAKISRMSWQRTTGNTSLLPSTHILHCRSMALKDLGEYCRIKIKEIVQSSVTVIFYVVLLSLAPHICSALCTCTVRIALLVLRKHIALLTDGLVQTLIRIIKVSQLVI